MHTIVQMFYLTRREFERNLEGLTDEDARKRTGPMNSISWIVAHTAFQHRAFFVDWPANKKLDPRYQPYTTGSQPSQPSLEEAMTLWNEACKDADAWLQAATKESLQEQAPGFAPLNESWGTLLVRCIFHTWCHLGEINSIRQILGHKAPEFVNMHRWSYDGT